ncbi:DUF4240 domain-containing protein [Streptomyces sp. NPDC059957]|uniref:DUF4240 domain-containing protein n=1 Tax=unclassified Streptomyces TaxID=2593676 RepID=UPI003662810E
MNKQQFWQLIEAARNRASNPHNGEAVAREATSLLASRPVDEIVAAEQVLWDLMVDSYVNRLWAAAYLAHVSATGDQLPECSPTIRYQEPDPHLELRFR